MTTKEKVSRKKQIELQATELFRTKGYSASSMRDLAQELGIEAASLYSHIRSKEEILQKIIFGMAERFFEKLNAIPKNENLSFAKQLEQSIIAHIEVITKNTAASAVFFNEWRHLSEPNLSKFLDLREEYEGRFRDIITKGMETNEFRDIDERFAVFAILSSLNWTHTWYKVEGKMSPEQIGRQLSGLLINGLKKGIIGVDNLEK
ncbi:TetR/AcrR family transcriptional regulator [Xanthovirga aplysinae]|uniref:TetR/AcrR family transcriptional regulator n=1 Tax=Xanthovirga aplysinae TaxID=2529853 RepID=UPI0012BD3558|nr:TetR/AcrR family transcriptional regulator [Xanthovirga aplysinae]MTI32968.1 TetR/AcrR family transcriptional regulator [Xanthovirga aplysinae]